MREAGNGNATLSGYKGQALTARALMYFDLVRLYGKPYNMDKASYGVPLVLEPLDVSAQPTRESVEAVYIQIMKDLTDAAPLLSKTVRLRAIMNYYANLAIQARVNLFMGNYTAALAAAEEIITSDKYTLYANANWVGSWSTRIRLRINLRTGNLSCRGRPWHSFTRILSPASG